MELFSIGTHEVDIFCFSFFFFFSSRFLAVPDAPQITFQPRSDAVREVDFNPFYGNYFAAAFDDGTVQVCGCDLFGEVGLKFWA